jgi:branched-chain amino acid transport system ATP-binding protein
VAEPILAVAEPILAVAEPILAVGGLTKRFGGLVATDQVSLSIPEGELHAIIGPNGAGKTTVIAQLAGEIRPDSGVIRFAGEDIVSLPAHARSARGLARSFQITNVFREFSAIENVALAVQAHAGHSFRFWRSARTDEALLRPASDILDRVGLAARARDPAAILSHGEKRALEIAMALATGPRLLLLDEPMAGMGPEDSAQMVRLLAQLKRDLTIVLIEHDMDAVFALADRITVLVYGRAIATGTPAAIRANDDVRQAYLGADEVA